jgi:hypothetical protein
MQKVKFFQKSEGSWKVCKYREKSFSWNPIFMKGFGEFHGNPIGFLQKLCFSTGKPIFAKK